MMLTIDFLIDKIFLIDLILKIKKILKFQISFSNVTFHTYDMISMTCFIQKKIFFEKKITLTHFFSHFEVIKCLPVHLLGLLVLPAIRALCAFMTGGLI